MTFRHLVKEVALEQGIYASFMPKPRADSAGSGMHTHMSLFEGDRNAFYEPGGEFQLSKVARAFIAGVLHHATEIRAVTNQWVNSYKRLISGRRGAVVRLLGPQQPLRAGAGADVQAEQGAVDAHRVPLAGPGAATRTSRSR